MYKITKVLILNLFIGQILLLAGFAFAKPVSKGIARQAAKNFLYIQKSLITKTVPKDKLYQYAQKADSELELARSRTIRNNDGTLLAYVHELNPEGFIITSADSKVRPILGYSFPGKFPFVDTKDNALLHLIKWDIIARLKNLKKFASTTRNMVKANRARWEKYTIETKAFKSLNKAAAYQDGVALITTNWYQTGHYNRKIPYKFPSVPLDEVRRPVGCVATAMSQIINYWQYPSSLNFDDSDSYNLGIDIDGDANDYGFPNFFELNEALTVINYNDDTEEEDDKEEEAYLNFAVGIKLGMKYGVDGSGVQTSTVARVLKDDFIYGSAEADNWLFV